jgi:hypothetical protein
MELGQPQHDRPATCVIAQQYSSTTFILLLFHSCKENFGASCKRPITSILFTFYKTKLLKSESAYIEIAQVGECPF